MMWPLDADVANGLLVECGRHTYYVTSSYILCHIIIHTMSHHHTYYVTSSYILCHIIHTMPSSRMRQARILNFFFLPTAFEAAGTHSENSSLYWPCTVDVTGLWLSRISQQQARRGRRPSGTSALAPCILCIYMCVYILCIYMYMYLNVDIYI